MLLTLKSCEFTPTAGKEWRNFILSRDTAQPGSLDFVPGVYCDQALLRPRKIGVALDQLFRTVIGETHGELAVVVLTIHVDDGANSIGWMAHALPDERVAAALASRRRGNFRSRAGRTLARSAGRM